LIEKKTNIFSHRLFFSFFLPAEADFFCFYARNIDFAEFINKLYRVILEKLFLGE